MPEVNDTTTNNNNNNNNNKKQNKKNKYGKRGKSNPKWSRKRKDDEKRRKHQEQKDGVTKNNDDYVVNIAKNPRMQVYYALQGLHDWRKEEITDSDTKDVTIRFIPNTTPLEKETERSLFTSTLRTLLPASFRISLPPSSLFHTPTITQLQSHMGSPITIPLATAKHSLLALPTPPTSPSSYPTTTITLPLRPLPFLPHAYQLSLDRRTISKNPSLRSFHDWMKLKTDTGCLTRQETVSMIPPLCLSPQASDVILDMCAAPGSKTCQLLETVGGKEGGLVIANDCDPKRAYMLVHQLRRMNTPDVFVTAVDARRFPGREVFDKVLCDVPCGGDGTLRKNPGIWKFWNVNGSVSLMRMQLGIAKRGIGLLKTGGTIVYSTCSLNPMENEAVVAELLRQHPNIELVDIRPTLPGLIARPGMTTWKVFTGEKRDKNFEKKNNAKMLKRRREWEEKNKKKQEEEEGGGKEEKETTEEGGEDKEEIMTVTDEVGDKTEESTTTEPPATLVAESIDQETSATISPTRKKPKSDEEDNSNTEAQETNPDNDNTNTTDPQPTPLSDDFFPTSWSQPQLLSLAKSYGLTLYPTYDNVPEEHRARFRPFCFPPTEEELKRMNLERCLRVLPHDMDSGGFFVAVLKKKSAEGEVGKEEEKEGEEEVEDDDSPSVTNDDDSTTTPIPQPPPSSHRRNNKSPVGDLGNSPFIPVDPSILADLIPFYGLSSDFPQRQIMARACGECKVLYWLSKPIVDLIETTGLQDRVTVINSGLKAFNKNGEGCEVRYRVNQEAIQYIAPYMTKRKVTVARDDFEKCLEHGNIPIKSFSSTLQPVLMELSVGSFVVCLEGYEEDYLNKMMLVMWKCRSEAINAMVGKIDMEGTRSQLEVLKGFSETEKKEEATGDGDVKMEINDGGDLKNDDKMVEVEEEKVTTSTDAPVEQTTDEKMTDGCKEVVGAGVEKMDVVR